VQAHAGVGVGGPRCLVERVAGRFQEALHTLVGAAGLAQVDGVVVDDLRIVRRDAQRGAELAVGLGRIVQMLEQIGARAVHVGAVGVLLHRTIELVLRLLQVALVQVGEAKLDVVGRGVLVAFVLRSIRRAARQQRETGTQYRQTAK